MPDLTILDNVKAFRKWNGEHSLIPSIRLKTIKKLSDK